MIEYIPGIVLLVIFAAAGTWQRGNEKRAWNGGICAASGRPWKCFDMDSQGGRGYSDGRGHTTWISYAVDRTANIGGEGREASARTSPPLGSQSELKGD